MTVDGVAFPFPIRPGMDVFSAYQDVYIGTVVRVYHAGGQGSGTGAGRETTPAHATQAPGLVHEEGNVQQPAEHMGRRVLGESLGPFPTAAAGNSGPVRQSAPHDYATDPGETFPRVSCLAVRPGRINLGPLTRPLYVPATAIRSLSMERIVLDVEPGDIPDSWRRAPQGR